jgi:hypothetical protein
LADPATLLAGWEAAICDWGRFSDIEGLTDPAINLRKMCNFLTVAENQIRLKKWEARSDGPIPIVFFPAR